MSTDNGHLRVFSHRRWEEDVAGRRALPGGNGRGEGRGDGCVPEKSGECRTKSIEMCAKAHGENSSEKSF